MQFAYNVQQDHPKKKANDATVTLCLHIKSANRTPEPATSCKTEAAA